MNKRYSVGPSDIMWSEHEQRRLMMLAAVIAGRNPNGNMLENPSQAVAHADRLLAALYADIAKEQNSSTPE